MVRNGLLKVCDFGGLGAPSALVFTSAFLLIDNLKPRAAWAGLFSSTSQFQASHTIATFFVVAPLTLRNDHSLGI